MRGSAAFRTGVAPGGALAGPWVRNPLWNAARSVPSLDLRFAENKSLVDATTGQNLVTFTRASSGTYVGSDGLIKTATTNEPRFDHNPTTGESLGLLVEESRSNLAPYSEDFTQWTNSNCPCSLNSGTAPDGTSNANKLTPNATNTTHLRYIQPTITAGVTYTMSVYAKAAEYNQIGFLLGQAGYGVAVEVKFNLTAGTYSIVTPGTNTTAAITSAGNGWYRCIVSSQATAGSTAQHQVRVLNENGDSSYAGNNIKGLYVWGAQLEVGSFPTSYIPTTTAAVTRSADVASITGSNFSSWYRQDEGTVFLDAASFQSVAAANVGVVINDGTLNNRIEIDVRAGSLGGAGRLTVISGGTVSLDTGNSSMPAFAVNTFYRQGASYKLDSFAFSLNGGVAQTDTSGGVPTAPDRIEIGARLSTALPLNGTIKRLTYFPARLANETLQQITQ